MFRYVSAFSSKGLRVQESLFSVLIADNTCLSLTNYESFLGRNN